jgi:putative redox protein
MQYELTARWVEGIAFNAEVGDFTVRFDSAPPEGSNTGPSPKRIMLASLIACTGMDVASLLQKMRVKYDAFSIEAVAPLTEEHPKVFKSVSLRYVVSGQNIKKDKVEKAINLSQEEYCGVSIMLKKHCPVEWELEVRGGD